MGLFGTQSASAAEPDDSVLAEARAIYEAKQLSDCDRKWIDRIYKIAEALDKNAERVQKQSLDADLAEGTVTIVSGEANFSYKASYPVEASGRWLQTEHSWDELYAIFEAIRNRPNDNRWSSLDALVRSNLFNDRGRLTFLDSYALDHTSEDALLSASQRIANLQFGERFLINPDSFVFLNRNAAFRDHFQQMNRTQDPALFVTLRERLAQRLAKDYVDRFGFVKNKGVTYSGGGEYRVELSAPGWTDAERREFGDVVRGIWNNNRDRRVHVEWALSRNAYTIEMRKHSGGRARTYFDQRKVLLFHNDSAKTIAHEIGHVLGFKDRYFTTWDAKRCVYTQSSLDTDIMSSHHTGSVLPEHWARLDREYGPDTTPGR